MGVNGLKSKLSGDALDGYCQEKIKSLEEYVKNNEVSQEEFEKIKINSFASYVSDNVQKTKKMINKLSFFLEHIDRGQFYYLSFEELELLDILKED